MRPEKVRYFVKQDLEQLFGPLYWHHTKFDLYCINISYIEHFDKYKQNVYLPFIHRGVKINLGMLENRLEVQKQAATDFDAVFKK